MEKCTSYDEIAVKRKPTAFERGFHLAKTGEYLMELTETRAYCNGTKEHEPCTCGGDRLKCNFYADVRKDARDELAKKAAEEREKSEPKCGEWISVKDRPPNAGEWIIVYPTRSVIGDVAEAYYIGDGVFTDEYYNFRGITHWMPLPEPPKESED